MYKNSLKPYVFLVFVVVLIDQITKSYFINFFINNSDGVLPVFPGFSFVNTWNEGVSFGMFSDFEYSNTLFFIISSVIVLVLIFMLFKEKTQVYSLSYALIIGGAIGNIVDRYNYGAVYDFIDIYVSHYHWPAFNIADSCVCVGVLLLLNYSLKVKR
jgi:signal peptidase II